MKARAVGWLLIVVTALYALREVAGAALAGALLPAAALAVIGLLAFQVRPGRLVFILVGLALTAALAALHDGAGGLIVEGLAAAGFIAAFFTGLTTLRSAAETSPAVQEAGLYLSRQPPGRRYLALTAGGVGFSLMLNYGSMLLLGGLALAGAAGEPNEEVRRHRVRRMLLAIQRGFIATLPWSPLSFSVAITTALAPGASWAAAAPLCMVSGLILAATGWALDQAFKPRLAAPPPPRAERAPGGWRSLLPLLGLLALLLGLVGGLHLSTGLRIVPIVVVVTPAIALLWIGVQAGRGALPAMAARGRRYAEADLPGYAGELALLMMAGYIGVTGAALLTPVATAAGVDLSAAPVWLVLVGALWAIPLLGQFGMNPILGVTLMYPLLPTPEAMGVSPTAVVVALTAGWALSGACSPFTATTLLIGHFGGVSATHVGFRWNGAYTLLAGLALSAWAVFYAYGPGAAP